jgi:hypothetical protein
MKMQSFHRPKSWLLLLAITFLSVTGCKKEITQEEAAQSSSSNDVIAASQSAELQSGVVAVDWYKLMLRMVLNANPPTPPNSRMFGYAGITLYEAVQNGIPHAVSLHTYLYQMPQMPAPDPGKGYFWSIAANAALADITRDLFGALTPDGIASIDSLEKHYYKKLSSDVTDNVAQRSRAFGRDIAAAIFDWSKSDNADHVDDPYTPPGFPGAWVPTPPLYIPAVIPYEGNIRTFLKMHAKGTVPVPYTYSKDRYSAYYKMAKHSYNVSQSLTDEQKTIALFWADPSGLGMGYTPPGHEISIVNQTLEKAKASLSLAAQVYAKAGIAQQDATIICFRSKYKDPRERPVTYIQKFIDKSWLPFLFTPPHPEWPAAHAYITPATLEVLSSFFGQHFAFTDHTYDFNGLGPRSYPSFAAAGIECGKSRFYGGIHYDVSVETSRPYGVAIGDDVAKLQLIR